MKLIAFDFKVFKYDWLVVFKEVKSGETKMFHNNAHELEKYMLRNKENVFIGFNSKHYDQYILKAIVTGANHGIIKAINDYIIVQEEQGFEHWWFEKHKFWFNCADIRDDCQAGLSLKSIEGHLGMDIEESSVSFDIKRPLTEKEVAEVSRYCTHEVDATIALIKLRKDYITTKTRLAGLGKIPTISGIGMTNAKITAAYLGARARVWGDERLYVYPDELKKELIPQKVLDFFDTLPDLSRPDPVIEKTSCTVNIGGIPVVIGWGGCHASVEQYYGETNDKTVIKNNDVQSLYPSLMIQYNYMSRNIESPQRFIQTYNRRIEAKAQGHVDGKTLKLPLNTASGAGENRYNAMYDPLPTRSIRITGQLFMIELAVRLLRAAGSFKLLNLNTDGIMYAVDRDELPIVEMVMENWQDEKRLVLEQDDISRVWIKDVNNLMFESEDGKVKTAGGYLNYGHHEKAGFNINNNLIAVAEAIKQYLLRKTPVEKTIGECDDPLKFQMIVHSGGKFSRVFQATSNGKEVELQRTNRIYATKQRKRGIIYRVSKKNGRAGKIPNCPDYCTVDNRNEVKIGDIDKDWYIELAKKRIRDYVGSGKQSFLD